MFPQLIEKFCLAALDDTMSYARSIAAQDIDASSQESKSQTRLNFLPIGSNFAHIYPWDHPTPNPERGTGRNAIGTD
jgi:hypothetical protein